MPAFNLAEYVTVQDRIRSFWQDWPDGRIETDIMSDPTDFQSCRYIARVFRSREDGKATATGWAFEHAGERGPNQTSHEENCETSAIGRALANMGYATSQKDRPSREEMEKVQRGQRTVTNDGEIIEKPTPQNGMALQVQTTLYAITSAPTLDQLARTFSRAKSDFKQDQEVLAKIIAAKDARKADLMKDEQPEMSLE